MSHVKLSILSAALCALGAGCGSAETMPDASAELDASMLGDGGADGSSTDGGADLGPAPVIGSYVHRYIAETGVVEIPVDLTQGPMLTAVVESSAPGGFTSFIGTGDASGAFSIPGVPVGPYAFGVGGTFYIATSSRALALEDHVLGRKDVASATQAGTTLAIAGTSMPAWLGNEELTFVARGADLIEPLTAASTSGMPAVNATTLNLSVNSQLLPHPHLVNGTKGDLAFVLLSSVKTASTIPYRIITSVLALPTFTQVDGQASSASAAFTALTLGQTASMDWKRSAFELHRTSVNPAAVLMQQVAFVHALPGGVALGQPTGTNRSLNVVSVVPASGPTDLSLSIPYASPLFGWASSGEVFSLYYVARTLGGATPISFEAFISIWGEATAFFAAPLIPLVSPPLAPKVAGQDAMVDQNGVGLTPELSWTPPAVGTPDGYSVTVWRIVNNAGAAERAQVANLRTALTHLKLVKGIFVAGQSYVLVIRAHSRAGVAFDQSQFKESLPGGVADAVTAVISP